MYQYSINKLWEWIQPKAYSNIVVLTDDNTAKYCLPKIQGFLPSGFFHINIPTGENSKTLESAQIIWDNLLENNIDRNALMINLGGGMITDLGGFCAATYKRGISFINIPTTLMGMVDASIGGKTGINIGGYKNQVGVFAMPEKVFIDPVFLATLPRQELVSGFAEVIKYGLIYDPELAKRFLGTHPFGVRDWMPIIQNCVSIKDEIVNKDPKETGLRKILNFGHTVGHALESYSLENDEKPLLHGNAVAFGLIAELYLSSKKAKLKFIEADSIADKIAGIYQIMQYPEFNNADLLSFMKKDKKNADGDIRFVLLENIGHAVYDITCSNEEIIEALEYTRNRTTTKYSDFKYAGINAKPDFFSGKVNLPSSKSLSNRILIIEALQGSKFDINNLSNAGDTTLMQSLHQSKGAELFVKNAGTVARFLLAYYASRPCDVILKGDARMNTRPIGELVTALTNLGADIEFLDKKDFLPVQIHGKNLKGGHVSISSNISSQFISALLMIGPGLENGLSIEMAGEIVSEPYIELTLSAMSYFGIAYRKDGNIITVPRQKYQPKPITIESDWSSASYFFALAALFPGSELEFDNLWEDSWQGDSIIKEIMRNFHVESSFDRGKCRIKSWAFALDQFSYDFIGCPDLVPTFVCLCCALKIPFNISGTKTLQYKESNRAEVLKTELAKLGYLIELKDNAMIFNGSQNTSEIITNSVTKKGFTILDNHEDHRLAMSYLLLAVKNPNVIIENSGVVNKSFPYFWSEIEKLGLKIENQVRGFSMEYDNFQLIDLSK